MCSTTVVQLLSSCLGTFGRINYGCQMPISKYVTVAFVKIHSPIPQCCGLSVKSLP